MMDDEQTVRENVQVAQRLLLMSLPYCLRVSYENKDNLSSTPSAEETFTYGQELKINPAPVSVLDCEATYV